MENLHEIKEHIVSVRETKKITDAMYRIASVKLRHAKEQLEGTKPYFRALQTEIKRVFRINAEANSRYFYPASGEHDLPGDYGYLVITADKGLAGSYNRSVLSRAEELMSEHDGTQLFVVGEYGRRYFSARGVEIEKSFIYTAQNPTFNRARMIADELLGKFLSGELRKIFVIYTDIEGIKTDVRVTRLLPFHRADFITPVPEKTVNVPFEFFPSEEKVLDSIVPSYVAGFIYSALVDSFCSEQEARMTAMDAANKSADELLTHLTKEYDRLRQDRITREIIEVSAGAQAQKQRKGM